LVGRAGVNGLPCNDVCKAYLAWSDRVSSMFRPLQPVAQAAVRPAKPAGSIARRRAAKPRQPSLNSFAQFPVRSDATPQSAETAQAEVAPSRPVDGIAERFPAAAGFVAAILAGTGSGTTDAPESTVVAAPDAIPSIRAATTNDDTAGGLNLWFALSLILLSMLSALVLRGWSRGRTADREPLISERTLARPVRRRM